MRHLEGAFIDLRSQLNPRNVNHEPHTIHIKFQFSAQLNQTPSGHSDERAYLHLHLSREKLGITRQWSLFLKVVVPLSQRSRAVGPTRPIKNPHF